MAKDLITAEDAVSNVLKNGGKSVEKLFLYVLGTLEATGAINLPSISHTIGTLSIAGIIAALHISTPTPKSGPGQV